MEQNIFHFKNLSQQKLTFWEFKSFMKFDVEKTWKKNILFWWNVPVEVDPWPEQSQAGLIDQADVHFGKLKDPGQVIQ